MAWEYEQKFNDLDDGDLHNQDSWDGATQFDVQTSVRYEGAKAVSVTGINLDITILRNFSAISSGILYIALRATVTNEEQMCILQESGANRMVFGLNSNGNVQIYGSAGWVTLIEGYGADTWYVMAIEFDDSGHPDEYRAKVHDGNSWGDWSDWIVVVGNAYSNIDRLQLNHHTGALHDGTHYFDTITPTDPTVAPPVAYTKTLTETLSVSESLKKIPVLLKSETLSVSESIARSDFSKALTEVMSISELSASQATFKFTLTDSLAFTESLMTIFGLKRTEALAFVESLSEVLGKTTSLTSTLSFSENIVGQLEFFESLIDTLSISESRSTKFTGWHSPTTTGAEWDTWTNPTDAYSSNNVWASRLDDAGVHAQGYGGFGFNIPEGSTIDGIEVKIEGKASADSLYIGIQMYRHSGPGYPNKSTTFDIAEGSETLGSSSDTWGQEWIASDFSNDNFIVAPMTFGSGEEETLYLDHIQVKVYYTEPISHTKTLTESMSLVELKTTEGALSKVENLNFAETKISQSGYSKTLSEHLNFLDELISHIPTVIRHILHIGP